MRKTSKLAVLCAAIAIPASALAAVSVGETVGTSDEEIRAKLEAAGYMVDEIEREDGEIEVEASLDGRSFEIEIAPDSGIVVEMELEDEEDERDDD